MGLYLINHKFGGRILILHLLGGYRIQGMSRGEILGTSGRYLSMFPSPTSLHADICWDSFINLRFLSNDQRDSSQVLNLNQSFHKLNWPIWNNERCQHVTGGLWNTRILDRLCPKILLGNIPPYKKNGGNFDSYIPYNEPIILCYINPWAIWIHSFHIPTDNYGWHKVCTFVVIINSSQETYMEKKYQYKGRQPNADSPHLPSQISKRWNRKCQKKSSLLIWWQPTRQILNMDKIPRFWWRTSMFVERIFTTIKTWCMKTNLDV